MEKKPLIGIVIVNFNGAKFQNECIESILKSTYQDFRIIVVDNGSTDDSMSQLSAFDDARIEPILVGENVGVAKGNNIGIERSLSDGCDASLILNNDTVLEPDMLEKLVKALEKDAAACPMIYYWSNPEVFWFCGGAFAAKKGLSLHVGNDVKDTGQPLPDHCEYAPTCCLLVKNSVIKEIGMMDEAYFLYFDDADFAMRLKLAGRPIAMVRDAKLYHKVSMSTGGATSKTVTYYMNRNRFYFLDKFKGQFSKMAKPYSYWTRKFKYWKSLFTRSNDRLIKKAYRDYKAGRMGRCDTL